MEEAYITKMEQSGKGSHGIYTSGSTSFWYFGVLLLTHLNHGVYSCVIHYTASDNGFWS